MFPYHIYQGSFSYSAVSPYYGYTPLNLKIITDSLILYNDFKLSHRQELRLPSIQPEPVSCTSAFSFYDVHIKL